MLCAYGSPNTKVEVKPYLEDIKGGPVSPHVVSIFEKRYAEVGGKTPLYEITKSQAELLEKELIKMNNPARVFVGMKHWHPYIADVVREAAKEGIRDLKVLALAPHYSKISIDGYKKAVETALPSLPTDFRVTYVDSWHDNPLLIECIGEQTKDALKKFDDKNTVEIIFTAHSLPSRIEEWNDPYEKELLATSKLVAQKIAHHKWRFAYQSAGHSSEPWLGPDILDTLSEIRNEGKKDILVVPMGFVSDHLEILYDIDIEAKTEANKLGLNLMRSQSRNTHPIFIKALASVVVTQS